MRRITARLFFAALLLLSGAAPLFALDVPKRPEGYVSDYANLLSDSARSRLEQELKEFEEQTSSQVLVVTFPRLGGDSLESYSIRLAEAWKPGQKGKDNGVILLVFKEDRKVRIEVGYGLEGVLTDALSRVIIENEIVPRFQSGDYDGGIEHAVEAILSATRGEYRPSPRPRGASGQSLGRLIGPALLIGQFLPAVLLWFLCLAGVAGIVFSVSTANSFFMLPSMGLLILSVLSLFLRLFLRNGFFNSSGLSGRGYYRGYGTGGLGGFGGGFGGGGGGFSGGGGGFGGGGSSGSW